MMNERMEYCRNNDRQGENQKYLEKICPSTSLPTTEPKRPALGIEPSESPPVPRHDLDVTILTAGLSNVFIYWGASD
jgi:hypothetical protein